MLTTNTVVWGLNSGGKGECQEIVSFHMYAHWSWGAPIFPGVKQSGHGFDSLHLSCSEVQNEESCTCVPPLCHLCYVLVTLTFIFICTLTADVC